MTTIHIDGALGEGGGQVVRSAIALSLITGKPLKLTNIRARRARPGLQRQHLTAVRAAAELAGASVEGARLGASSLAFHPPHPAADGGEAAERRTFHFRIGTAGSTTLVAQTVLPALLGRRESAEVRLEGGTHNPLAPPFDYLHRVYLPLLNQMGFVASAQLVRHGFYPAGGGEIALDIGRPTQLKALQLVERGALRRIRVRALLANLPRHIAERECQTVRDLTDWEDADYSAEVLSHVAGAGNVLLIETHFERVTEVFCSFGQKGVRAETVAETAVTQARDYLSATAPVGPHLADQLLLPLALVADSGAGTSRFHTTECTDHFHTHRQVITQFLPVTIRTREQDDGQIQVEIAR